MFHRNPYPLTKLSTVRNAMYASSVTQALRNSANVNSATAAARTTAARVRWVIEVPSRQRMRPYVIAGRSATENGPFAPWPQGVEFRPMANDNSANAPQNKADADAKAARDDIRRRLKPGARV